MEIPKTAMRATNNAMRGYIPNSGVVSARAKIVARQQSKEKKQGSGKRKKRVRAVCAAFKPGRSRADPVIM